VRIVFDKLDRSLLIKIYLEFMSSYLKFDSGRRIGRAAVVILLVNLFVIKVRSELGDCGHTGHMMNDY